MFRTRWLIAGIIGLAVPFAGHAAGVDTNPMNYDPQVRAAYKDFYNLDYTGAVELFERYHQAHQGDPQATAYLLTRSFSRSFTKRTC